MAICHPSDEVTRLVKALGVSPDKATRVTLNMAVNNAVTVSTVEYVSKEQVNALATEIVEKQYRLVRWISVGERLPEIGCRVLVANAADDWVAVGERHITGAYHHWDGDDGEELHEPTHWMPMIDPPDAK